MSALARFKAKRKEEHLLVRVRMSRGEQVNNAELDSLAHTYIRGFLKPRKVRKNIIEYTGPMGVSLHDRMKSPVSRYEFLIIMEQIVDAFQKLYRYKFLPGRVIWDIHYIYFNEQTKELQFIYLPLLSVKGEYNILNLLYTVGYAAMPVQEGDTDYVYRFMDFLSSLPVFRAESIEKFIEREDRNVVYTIKKHGGGQSGFITDKRKDFYEHYGKKDNEDEETGLLDEDEETGLLDEDEETGLLNEEGTGLLAENQMNIHYPSLFRVLTEETISVNKPVFRIGKEKSYVDYFVQNNGAVSRSHADIITRAQRYFVIDLNSTNKTYLNGWAIPAQQEIEIYDGDRLRFANEEFTFSV